MSAPLRPLHFSSRPVEATDSRFIEAELKKAQARSWVALREIEGRIREGMTEFEGRQLALEVLRAHGAAKNWHQPWIRFGAGTLLNFAKPLQEGYRLMAGDPVSIDLGPIWKDPSQELAYEGDVGDSFVFGKAGANPVAEKCVADARALFQQGRARWSEGKSTGVDLYGFLRGAATELGYSWVEEVDGHRIADFPHQKYARSGLAELDFVPHPSVWILEVQICKEELGIGAFFEDILV